MQETAEQVYKMRDNVLTAKQCKDIEALWPHLDVKVAETYNDRVTDNVNPNYRKGEVAFLTTDQCPHWARIKDEILRYNIHQGINLNGFFSIQLARYTRGCMFKRHQDTTVKMWSRIREPYNTRKISASIQLSDDNKYKGGDFQLMTEKHEKGSKAIAALRNKGSMIMFPSYCEHWVDEVTEGERFSLVIWAHGPHWI